MDYKAEYQRWLEKADEELKTELKIMDDAAIEDAFYRDLAFGTGGLRGTIGAGTNRMNVHVVGKASQGLSNYLKAGAENPSVVIGYDSRIKSDVFAKVAASVFAANGIHVHIWPQLLPVPTVSYAVRALHASAGVMITASHNPSKYNGYKVYGPDGCQITTEAAAEILEQINALDIFADVKSTDFEAAVNAELVKYINPSVLTDFIEEVKGQSVLFGDEIDKNVSIVYSPLNGTGLVPVTRCLSESGFTNITVVEEQRNPDGNFPTCPYPNPEIREAMELGLQYCEKTGADLLLATDPDCDRCGIAVRNGDEYQLLSLLKDEARKPIFFVLNQLDRFNKKQDSVGKMIKDYRNDLIKIGFSSPIIIPTSAEAALLFKLPDSRLDDEDVKDRDTLYSRFCQDYYQLTSYIGQPSSINPIENTGINYLEKLIKNI